MKQTKITLFIVKKNRKYFDCIYLGRDAKLVINEISQDFTRNLTVDLNVEDISERSVYGVKLKFEPLSVLEIRPPKNLSKLSACTQTPKIKKSKICITDADIEEIEAEISAMELDEALNDFFTSGF